MYDASPNPVLALEGRIVRKLLRPISRRRFIDVACGTGRWTEYLVQKGGIVFGADLCGEMLAEASRKAGTHGKLILADAASLPFRSNLADVSLCSLTAGYLPDLNDVFAELARVTKRRGTVIVSDLHPEGIASGWTRSFRVEGTRYEMHHFSPSVDCLLAAGHRARLTLQKQVNAHFGPPERHFFSRSGAKQRSVELSTIPALWIGVWIKP
jgi:ubiquinone/menaquinone biosynthesis C-methylase UbiE